MNRRRLESKRVRWPAAALAVVLLVAAGGAARAADADTGRALARTWCSSCHVVDPGGRGSDAARAFEAIAKDQNTTENGLRAWLADPHPPMPNFNLSRTETDAIIAYLEWLRDR